MVQDLAETSNNTYGVPPECQKTTKAQKVKWQEMDHAGHTCARRYKGRWDLAQKSLVFHSHGAHPNQQ
jgi:hypothetical protein